MKQFSIFSILLFSFFASAQSPFYEATLTKLDGETEMVFLKSKRKVLDKNAVEIYTNPDLEKKVYEAKDFLKLEADEIEFISTLIPELNSNKIVLRRITTTNPSLFEYESSENEITYILQFKNQFKILRKQKKGDLPSYKEWLFNNYNPNDQPIIEFSDLKYSREGLSNYLNKNNEDFLLNQEPEVKFFNLFASAGINFNSVKVSNTQNRNFPESASESFQFGLKGQFNFDRVTNNFSVIAGINYQTTIKGSDQSTVFPNSNLNRVEEDYSYSLDFTSFYLGPQFNFHLNKWMISPFITYEPVFLKNDKSNLVLAEDITTVEKIDNTSIFNVGLAITYSGKLQFSCSYGTYSDLPLLMKLASASRSYSIDISRIQVSLNYRIL